MTTTVTDRPQAEAPQSAHVQGMRLETIPLDALTRHPGNVRKNLKITKAFRTSVLRRMVTPLLVVALPEGGYKVFDGHRRLVVLVDAKRPSAPCLVFDDLSAAEEFLAMAVTARQREGLSDDEQALALFEAVQLGTDDREAADATGLTKKQVRTAVRFAGSEKLRKLTGKAKNLPALGLDQMAALLEFENDPAAVEQLTAAAESGNFDWHLEKLRSKREARRKFAEQGKEYRAAGIQVIDSRSDLPDTAAEVWGLADADGRYLSRDDHQSCPGHVMAPWDDEGTGWNAFCLDPAAHGHQVRITDPSRKPKAAKDPAAMRAVKEGNRDWEAATTVRRNWLAQFARRRTWAKETQEAMSRFAAREMIRGGYVLNNGFNADDSLELMRQWLAMPEDAGWKKCAEAADQAGAGRLPFLHFATVGTRIEKQAGARDRRAWRTDSQAYTDDLRGRIGDYLRALGELGYELSPIEQAVADRETYHPLGADQVAEALGDDEAAEDAEETDGTDSAEDTDGTEEAEETEDAEDAEEADGTDSAEDTDGTEEAEETEDAEDAEEADGTEEAGPVDGAAQVAEWPKSL